MTEQQLDAILGRLDRLSDALYFSSCAHAVINAAPDGTPADEIIDVARGMANDLQQQQREPF